MFEDSEGKLRPPPNGLEYMVRYSVEVAGRKKVKSAYCANLPEAKKVKLNGGPLKQKATSVSAPKEPLFHEHLEAWKASYLPHLAGPTQVKCMNRMRHLGFFAHMLVKDIDDDAVLAWLSFLKKPENLATMSKTRMNFREEWKLLGMVLKPYRKKNPSYVMPCLEAQKTKLRVREGQGGTKDLSLEELKAFLKVMRDSCKGEREVFYYLALFQYGIYGRIQDAAALHFEDFRGDTVRVARKSIFIKGNFVGFKEGAKEGQGKTIPMNPYLRRLLNEWKLKFKHAERTGPMFLHNGAPLDYRQIKTRYDYALRKAGISHKGTHLIRHASLTEVYHQTKDLKTTAELAGHKNIVITQRYAKAREEETRAAQERMSEQLLGVIG
jgi:integrase